MSIIATITPAINVAVGAATTKGCHVLVGEAVQRLKPQDITKVANLCVDITEVVLESAAGVACAQFVEKTLKSVDETIEASKKKNEERRAKRKSDIIQEYSLFKIFEKEEKVVEVEAEAVESNEQDEDEEEGKEPKVKTKRFRTKKNPEA